MAAIDDRIERERAFHDERFDDDSARAATGKFYRAVPHAGLDYHETVDRLATGRVLEYGCGAGSMAFDLSRRCDVVGIDISPVAIQKAAAQAAELGVSPSFVEMNAESLDFDPNSFDLICGSGILHHLDIDVAVSEIERVVKPGGSAVFFEPLGYNPLINWYRDRTPGMRSDDEHPLKRADLARLTAATSASSLRFHGLSVLAAAPIIHTPLGDAVRRSLTLLDRAVLRVPGVRLLAWIVVIELQF